MMGGNGIGDGLMCCWFYHHHYHIGSRANQHCCDLVSHNHQPCMLANTHICGQSPGAHGSMITYANLVEIGAILSHFLSVKPVFWWGNFTSYQSCDPVHIDYDHSRPWTTGGWEKSNSNPELTVTLTLTYPSITHCGVILSYRFVLLCYTCTATYMKYTCVWELCFIILHAK